MQDGGIVVRLAVIRQDHSYRKGNIWRDNESDAPGRTGVSNRILHDACKCLRASRELVRGRKISELGVIKEVRISTLEMR